MAHHPSMPATFRDRADAGRQLAALLVGRAFQDPVVVGVPRGGVPVAAEVSEALQAPLDVIVVRKLGVPYQPELAMGAVGESGVLVVNEDIRRHVGRAEFLEVERRERENVRLRASRFRGHRHPVALLGRTVIIVDDGLATGATMRAACRVARAHGAHTIVVAIPVAGVGWQQMFAGLADECVAVHEVEDLQSVGRWYEEFPAVADDEVMRLLRIREPDEPVVIDVRSAPDVSHGWSGRVSIPINGTSLDGRLVAPAGMLGLIIFAHGSGSSARSPRNTFVAARLNDAGFGTLLFDLLTPDEAEDRSNVFDVTLMAMRLTVVTRWLRAAPSLSAVPMAYFGASTGAAAALWAASDPSLRIAAVVSRGGRPDLAAARLGHVMAPTRLIVGGNDDIVIGMNRTAAAMLACPHDVVVIPGASHLFGEPGALEQVASLASAWFREHVRDVTVLSTVTVPSGADVPVRSGEGISDDSRRVR